jgi:hypothetical protein
MVNEVGARQIEVTMGPSSFMKNEKIHNQLVPSVDSGPSKNQIWHPNHEKIEDVLLMKI